MARPSAAVPNRRRRARVLHKREDDRDKAPKCLLSNGRMCCFFFAALLQFILGVVCLGFGLVLLWGKERVNIMLEVDISGSLQPFNVAGLLKSGFVALMLAGSSVLILGFLGCCGVMMRSKVMVATYGVIVLLIAVGQMTAAGLALGNRQQAQQLLRQSLLGDLRSSYTGRANTSRLFSHAMDLVQMAFGCCGVTGPQDFYNATPWWLERPANCSPCAVVPSTCCKLRNASITDSYLYASFHANSQASRLMLADPLCPFKAAGPDNPNTHTGCLQAIVDEVSSHIILVLVLAVLVVLVESYAISSAFRVVSLLRRQDRWVQLQERHHVGSSKRRLASMALNQGPAGTTAPPSATTWI